MQQEILTTFININPKDPEDRKRAYGLGLYSLSVSKAKSFESCKAKFKFSYIDKLPRKDNIYTPFGNFLHEILENFHKGLLEDPNQDRGKLMGKCFKDALVNWKDKLQPANPEKKTPSNVDEAKQICQDYLNKICSVPLPNIQELEKHFYLNIDGKILANGFIDKVQIDNDNIYHVIDYKTNKDKKYLKDVFQLETYAFVLMLENPEIKIVRASYELLRHKFKMMTSEFKRDDIMAKVPQKYLSFLDNIEQEQIFRANTTRLCGHCEYLEHCQPGKSYLRKNGLLNDEKTGLQKWGN